MRKTKKCPKCNKEKSLVDFNKKSKHSQLKERSRWYHIKKTYGLSKDDWYRIYNDQGGRCFICQRTEAQIMRSKMKFFTVDHCHATGHIRGLLCGHCNKNVLPAFERDNAMATRIAIYLSKEHKYGKVPLFQNTGLKEAA